MKATRAPKARKLRAHPSGISCKCKAGKCFDCSMLECQHDCHETLAAEEINFVSAYPAALRLRLA